MGQHPGDLLTDDALRTDDSPFDADEADEADWADWADEADWAAQLAALVRRDDIADLMVFDNDTLTDVFDTSSLTTIWPYDVFSGRVGVRGGRVVAGGDPGSLTIDLVPRLAGEQAHPLTEAAAGGELATLLEIFELSTLRDASLVDFVAACERQKAWTDSLQLAATVELTARCARLDGVGDRPDQVSAEDMAAAELAPALGLSPASAVAKVGLAASLVRLPGTSAALADGTINLFKARVIADAIDGLDDDAVAEVEARILPKAGSQTVPISRRRCVAP